MLRMVPMAGMPVAPRRKKQSYADMAAIAISRLQEPTGSSMWAIEKFIQSEFSDITYRRVYLTNALRKSCESGRLLKHPHHSSSYMLGEVQKPKSRIRQRPPKRSINVLDLAAGHVIRSRYQVLAKCGKGSFGCVLHCRDTLEDRDVAIKVSKRSGKSSKSELASTLAEFQLLKDIEAWEEAGLNSPPSLSRCVKPLQAFEDQGMVCLVLEKLGTSLVSYLKATGFVPLPLPLVRNVGRQVLESLCFLHAIGVAHLDVKPHNILFTTEAFTTPTPVLCTDATTRSLPLPADDAVKLIDFGGSRYVDDQDSGYSYTTEFRSPEVVMDLEFSAASDMWSVGCVLMQLYTGQLLFRKPTAEKMTDQQHLLQMLELLGPMPPRVALDAQEALSSVAVSNFTAEGVLRTAHVQRPVSPPRTLRQRVHSQHASFLDLLQQMLRYDPHERVTASAALAHPFFADSCSSGAVFTQQSLHPPVPRLSGGMRRGQQANPLLPAPGHYPSARTSSSGPSGLFEGARFPLLPELVPLTSMVSPYSPEILAETASRMMCSSGDAAFGLSQACDEVPATSPLFSTTSAYCFSRPLPETRPTMPGLTTPSQPFEVVDLISSSEDQKMVLVD